MVPEETLADISMLASSIVASNRAWTGIWDYLMSMSCNLTTSRDDLRRLDGSSKGLAEVEIKAVVT